MKKASPEVRAYIRTRIVDYKERGYAVKYIGELLNVADDYVYHVLEQYRKNGNILQEEKVRGRKEGKGRILSSEDENELQKAITENTPDKFSLLYSLWNREAVQELEDVFTGKK